MERFPYKTLKDPKFFKSENCLPAHSDNVVYGCAAELGGESSLRRSLNGSWRFSWSANVDAAPRDFFRLDADLSAWGEIQVPGHMQMQGYGVPQYANYEYPWDGREDILPGQIPKKFNPVGSYVREFEIPNEWGFGQEEEEDTPGNRARQQLFLRFEGVESGFALWVDGNLVGYSEDTFTPSEFEITEFLSPEVKKHKLAVQVFTWTASSWLEDQDFFRFSGIFRDVWLYTKTDFYPENINVTAEPDEDFTGGTLDVQIAVSFAEPTTEELWDGVKEAAAGISEAISQTFAELSTRVKEALGFGSGFAGEDTDEADADASDSDEKPNKNENTDFKEDDLDGDEPGAFFFAGNSDEAAEAGKAFTAECVLTKDGNEVLRKTLAIPANLTRFANGPQGTMLHLHEHLSNVDLWSAEHPALYHLTIVFRDANGAETACICQKVGFRRFELKDGLMLLNGKRIVFNGVNRHEFSADRGRVPNPEEVLRDVIIMKQNNINAVRTSHYQNAPYIYDLCDEFGIYMIAENNLETHGSWGGVGGGMYPPDTVLPNNHMEYLPLLKDRMTSTCELNKNHPSVLIWSLGNESCGGQVLSELAKFVREQYPGRLVHYEGIFHDRTYPDTSDMESQMYTPVAGIEKFLKENPENPFISCEYMHAMGNSIGGLFKYTDLAKREPRYQGGFIWDFVDQAIRTTNVFGEEYLAYGGDLGERPHDGNFSGDGIIDADRKPYAKMQEVKFCYQNVDILIEEKASCGAALQTDGMEDCAQQTDGEGEKARSVRFVNRFLFTDLSEFDGRFTLLSDGETVLEEAFAVAAAPQSEVSIPLPVSILDAAAKSEGKELVLTASLCLKEDTPWAKKGYEIAFGQGLLKVGEAVDTAAQSAEDNSEEVETDSEAAPKDFSAEKERLLGAGRRTSAKRFEGLFNGDWKEASSLSSEHAIEASSEEKPEPVVFSMNRLFASERASAAAGAAAAGEGGLSADEGAGPWEVVKGILAENPPLRLIRGGFNVGAVGDGFDVLFSGLMGNLVSYRVGGRELLRYAPPRPNFWRAPNDNDRANGQPARSGIWKLASAYASHMPGDGWPKVVYDGQMLAVTFRYVLPGSGLPVYALTYRVTADGTVRCTLSFPGKEGLPPMPDFGLLFELSPEMANVRYYGLGPAENYCDRNMGAKLGIYEANVGQMPEPYLKPQETGNRTGVRWAEVTDNDGFGLWFAAEAAGNAKAAGIAKDEPATGNAEEEAVLETAEEPGVFCSCGNPLAAKGLNFSAIPWKPEELEAAAHAYELPRSAHTYVRISAMQMGVGGDDTWGAMTHPEFLPSAEKPVEFTFTFRGINACPIK